ncbi:TPA: hypothetical protein O8U20_002545 [Enterobacter cloacae]|uniref:hypothetical protein n=1 Tax=Enterobacter cloacae TaxID=550 RepID=UPI00077BB9A6|nr:hypothetical protein [Enterobacter cloacae]MCK6804135.1 hypothetical protein [Enterobacter cloacae]MCK6826949.1 hypothetical protein [Enterobacter cloacae]HDC4404263.1 hypothetical protein [Enterobacter cloacae]HDC4601093.1 hypothetical protein [Enterobacter cloacae]
MLKERGFKKRYALSVILIVMIWIIYMIPRWIFPVEYRIYKKTALNDSANIYIVQSDAGATTAFGYHYYLIDNKTSDNDFISHLDDYTPFLKTRDANALRKVDNGQIYLNITGDIYYFSSPAQYRIQSNLYRIGINLVARP